MLGQTLGHYRILEKIGAGGMGEVYRARDERLGREVALKLLRSEMASQKESRARLLAEARAAAGLNHPGIMTIYDVGEEGGRVFIVMELVSGHTVRAMASESPIELRTVLRFAAQLAEALAAAHPRGVVHGDIKPENIMVLPEGRIKLLDFGIAREVAAETLTLTRAAPSGAWLPESRIAGTLAYMAPEQLRGEPSDHRADLFALGVVLYELVAGQRPFRGPTASVLMGQILNEQPPLVNQFLPSLPAELARIVHKLLEKQPNSRYQSAREVQVDLTNLIRDLELGAAVPATTAGKRAVAVLPFKLLTPNPEDEYLSVALADAVVSRLGSSGELLVRPTSTVMRYATQAVDPLLAARELNVQLLVEGSIQKLGQRLRVHVQAWNARDGATLFSAKHDAETNDLFGLQDRIADGLAGAFGVLATAAVGLTAPPTKNPAAYELFLRASERLSRWNRWDTRTAIEMLENVTELDPNFADAWARLAEARRQLGIHFELDKPWIPRAEREIRRALSLDPTNADAQCVRGRILWTPAKRFQNRAALRALSDALRLNPGCHQAQVERGCLLFHLGLHEAANRDLSAALATSPDDVSALAYLGQTAVYNGDYEEAERYYARARSLDPAHLWVNLFGAAIPLYREQLEAASERIRHAMQVVPGDPMAISLEALLRAKRGETSKAERATRLALRAGGSRVHTHHTLHNLAAAYAVLGKPAPAVALLRNASRIGLPNYSAFRNDPHFAPLKANQQFKRLLGDLERKCAGFQRELDRC